MKRFILVVSLFTLVVPVFAGPPACATNLLQNPTYSDGSKMIGNGSMPPSTVAGWVSASRDPQLVSATGCGNPGYIAMWGNQALGEAIRQKLSAPLVQGETYRFSVCVRYANPSAAGPVRIRVRASNGPLASYTAASAASVVSPDITSQDWVMITLPYLKINAANLDTITISPENASATNSGTAVSWAHIDNVCLERISIGLPIVAGGTDYKVGPGVKINLCTFEDGVKVSDVGPPLSNYRPVCTGMRCLTEGATCESTYEHPNPIWQGPPDTVFTAAQQQGLLNAAEKIAAGHVEMCGDVRKEVWAIDYVAKPTGMGPNAPMGVFIKVHYAACSGAAPPH